MRRRPAGAVPRHPQPDPDRPWHRAASVGCRKGFGRTSSTTSDQTTPRNLMGFKDGTNNLHAGHDDLRSERVGGEAATTRPGWPSGSYLVARRIRIRIEIWDRSALQDQEADDRPASPDRAHRSVAPTEFDAIDLDADGDRRQARDPGRRPHRGWPTRTPTASTSCAGATTSPTASTPDVGQLDAGLFFLAYQRDPRTQFIPLQQQAGRAATR